MKKDASFGLVPMYKDGDRVEFLIIQQVAGHWSFPKGHAEAQETPLETAHREFIEETGIVKFQVDKSISFQEEYYPEKDGEILHKTVIYYPAWVSDKVVKMQEMEIQDFAWLEYKQALERITFPGAKKILKQTKKYLSNLNEDLF